MKTNHLISLVALLLLTASASAANPFVGRWALTLPDGRAGWLGIEEKDGKLSGSLLWGGGSVLPLEEVSVNGDTLTVVKAAKNAKQQITAKADGDTLKLKTVQIRPNGKPGEPAEFTGKRIADLPPKPDLSKVQYTDPMHLLDGETEDLLAWKPTNPDAPNGWSLKDGVLSNRVSHEKGKRYANLRTVREFEDFRLTVEVRTPEGSNSGIYLRGVYEIQIAETHGKPVDSHNMGALYSRITPKVSAEKPAGEWQTMEITLVDRHLTVVLNGKTIIDNEPVLGCTGGAMSSDESKPGPIMLQGDHTDVDYRNFTIYPVKK